MEAFKIYITHFDFIISHKKSIKIFEVRVTQEQIQGWTIEKWCLSMRKLGQCSI